MKRRTLAQADEAHALETKALEAKIEELTKQCNILSKRCTLLMNQRDQIFSRQANELILLQDQLPPAS